MSPGLVGYHPERIADLHRRVSAAADDLRSLSSTDPAAVDALPTSTGQGAGSRPSGSRS